MNDTEKHVLRRANDTPWYCLATLYGEQPAQGDWDRELAAKNRMAWNRWIAGVLSDERRADLLKNGFSEPELVPFSLAEKSDLCTAFASRVGREEESPPNPTDVVDFTHVHFDRVVSFGGFLCAGDVDFSSAMFSGDADFSVATFFGNAYFRSATFSDYADFSSATFSGIATFHSTKFLGVAAFRSATFANNASLRSVTFSGVTDFSSATFSGIATFLSATFSGVTDFSSAKFSGAAEFSSTTFDPSADFSSATFSTNADFSSATFFQFAVFSSATFSGDADFSSASFSQVADFINAEFAARTVFANVRFESAVPDFRGAKMHEATEWHGVGWPSAPQDNEAAQAQVYAYERLKQEMERLKKHEDEQFFFRKELRARRGLISPWSGVWLLNYVYEASSDYGQSIERPLLWLFVLFVSGSVLFSGTPAFKGTRMTIPGAAAVSFANIFSFLPVNREVMTAGMVNGLSSAAQIVGTIQSVLGVLLLFLLSLALRTRFRMR